MKKRLLPPNTLVAIDVGTTKVCVLIAQKIIDDQFDIIGIGRAPSRGMAQGVVTDIAPAVQSIKAAVQEAELMAGCTIESAYIGISGAHISTHQSSGMVPIKNGIIRESDVSRVIAAARAIPLSEDEHVLHVIPQIFTIDGKHSVRDPLSMHGVRLEVKVNIITGNVTQVKNLIRCCETAGVKVQDIVLEPIASAESVLSIDERDMGVLMLDIGGGTSDLAIYQRDVIRHAKIFPIAGALFTNDIALCLRTTREEAERIKRQHSVFVASGARDYYTIRSVDGESSQAILIEEVAGILHARSEELFMLVKEEIDRCNLLPLMPAGVVITGGGALLSGIAEHAEEVLGVPARVGRPRAMAAFRDELQNPIYATGYGLVVYAFKEEQTRLPAEAEGPIMGRIFWKMKHWIADIF